MIRLFHLFIFCLCIGWKVYAQQTVGLFLNTPEASPGYTLFTSGVNTYLIDNCGKLINEWESQYFAGNSVYLLEDGNLLRTARIGGVYSGGGSGGRIELFSWDNELLWSFNYSTQEYQQHHDIAPLPNGNILLIAWEGRTKQEAIVQGSNPDLVTNFGVWSEQITEIEPVGTDDANIVWQWQLWDHLVQDFDETKANFGVVAEQPGRVNLNYWGPNGGNNNALADWIHLNAINYNEELDQIALSSRHLSEIWIIDHGITTEEAAGPAGDLLYRWGNPHAYGRGTETDQQFFGQHDIQWIEEGLPGAGNLIAYNNGADRPGEDFSTVEEWIPPLQPDGTYEIADGLPYGPSEPLWTYDGLPDNPFFSGRISGVQRLPNGNTLICEGQSGHLFETTPEGEIVWDYVCPVTINGPVPQGNPISSNSIFRAWRYPEDYSGFEGKLLIPGGPIEINPLPYDCITTSSTVSVGQAIPSLRITRNPIQRNELVLENPNVDRWAITVYTIAGQPVSTVTDGSSSITIKTSDWSRGLYVLHAVERESGQNVSIKFLKP